jgi:hypothetical protein
MKRCGVSLSKTLFVQNKDGCIKSTTPLQIHRQWRRIEILRTFNAVVNGSSPFSTPWVV